MAWKFWQKPKLASPIRPTPPDIDWNTDAYDSVKFLCGMYVKDTPPFALWRDPEAELLPEIEELASTNVKAYQLCLWFAMYRSRRGAIEARMLRDAFFNVFDVLSEGDEFGKQMRWLLDFQEKAVAYVDEIPADKKASVEAGLGTQMPPEYYIAMYQLLGFPESPYAPDKQELPEAQQRALAICLLNGRMAAQEFFTPMLDAIQAFDPAKIPHWEWSKTLGAYERVARQSG